jgi:uncharacterized protein involved in exopolysaccharide biosynthesis
VQGYVRAADNGSHSLSGLLSRWRTQAHTATLLRRRVAKLPKSSSRAASMQTDLDTAELKEQTLRAQYQDRSAEVSSTAGIEVITPATTAASDRHRTLQRLGVVGLIAGALVGSALAIGAERLRARRRLR